MGRKEALDSDCQILCGPPQAAGMIRHHSAGAAAVVRWL